MADWGYAGSDVATAVGASSTTSLGVPVIAAATPHTKGAWYELSPALPHDACGVFVSVLASTGSTPHDLLVDVGIGAAGGEVVIIPNLPVRRGSDYSCGIGTFIPSPLPEGARLVARCQSSVASGAGHVSAIVCAPVWQSPLPGGVVETLGVIESFTFGTIIFAAAQPNVKGSWVYLGAPSFDYAEVQLLASAYSHSRVLLDLAVFDGATYHTLLPNVQMGSSSTSGGAAVNNSVFRLPLALDAGAPIYARIACATANAAMGVVLLGVSK